MADPQFEQALAKANSLVAEGKLDDGANLYEQLIAHAPHNLELYRDLALVYERKGDIPKAITTFLRWAGICAQLGLNDEALKLYSQVLSLEATATNPEKKGLFKSSSTSPDKIRELVASARPEICLQIGRIFLQKSLADEAIKYLKGALDSAQGAQDHRVHTLLGIAYMQKQMDKEAIGEFQEVVRIAPNDAAFAYEKLGEIYRRTRPTASSVWYRNAGDLYLRNEQYQEAVGAYEVILQFEPRNKDVLQRLAEIYTQLGMTEQALATWRTLAAIYTEEGLLDKVIILYEKLTELNPHDDESWGRLLEIYRGILQRDPSNLSVRSKLIKHLLSRDDHAGAVPEYIALAQAYLEKGVLDEAWQILAKVLEVQPTHAKALELLGDVHLRREEKDQALARYLEVLKIYSDAGDEESRRELSQKLTELFPEESGVQYELARSLKDQGSFGEALSEIMKVLEQDPNHVQAMSEASDLLLQMGRGEEARDLYKRILELEPTRTDIRLKLFEYFLSVHDIDGARTQVDELAGALRAAGMLREAEMVYRRMLSYHPDNAEIRLQISALRLETGDVEGALREYLLLANMFVRRQLLERAAEMYAAILQHRPDNLSAHRNLGRVRARQGETAEALGHMAWLAQIYLERNLSEQALGVLRECVDIDPANVELRQRLVELLVRLHRLDEAAEQYPPIFRGRLEAGALEQAVAVAHECMTLQPLNLDLRLELATAYLEFNRLDEGLTLLEALVEAYLERGENGRVIDIYDKMAHVYRAQERLDLYWQVRERTAALYRQEGRNAEALGETQEIIEAALLEGDAVRARALFPGLADLYVAEQRVDEGVRAIERLVESFAREGKTTQAEVAQDFLLQLLERKGDQGQALEVLKNLAESAQASGDLALALVLYGRVYDMLAAEGDSGEAAVVQFIRIRNALTTRDIEAARALWATLRALRPQAYEDVSRYAELLDEHGYQDEALPLLVEMFERDPDDAVLAVRLAVLSARVGDMGRAAALARKLIAAGVLDRIMVEISALSGTADGERCLRFGDFYCEMGFYEEALSQYQMAARHPQQRLQALNRMAFLFRKAGYVDLAARQLVRTLEQSGYDDEELVETRYNLATLYYEAGRHDEALAMYNECAAVRLRYRDVAERIEELTALVASGGTKRADVLPFARSEEPVLGAPAVEAVVGTVAVPVVEAFADSVETAPAVDADAAPVVDVEAAAATVAAVEDELLPIDEPAFEPVVEVPDASAEAAVVAASEFVGDSELSIPPTPEVIDEMTPSEPDQAMVSDVLAEAPIEAFDVEMPPEPLVVLPVDDEAPAEGTLSDSPVTPEIEVTVASSLELEMAPSIDPALLAELEGASPAAPAPPPAPPPSDFGDDDFFLEGPPPDPTKA